ncbi:hypothetical protein ACLOJK_009363 [Asimina triloba]
MGPDLMLTCVPRLRYVRFCGPSDRVGKFSSVGSRGRRIPIPSPTLLRIRRSPRRRLLSQSTYRSRRCLEGDCEGWRLRGKSRKNQRNNNWKKMRTQCRDRRGNTDRRRLRNTGIIQPLAPERLRATDGKTAPTNLTRIPAKFFEITNNCNCPVAGNPSSSPPAENPLPFVDDTNPLSPPAKFRSVHGSHEPSLLPSIGSEPPTTPIQNRFRFFDLILPRRDFLQMAPSISIGPKITRTIKRLICPVDDGRAAFAWRTTDSKQRRGQNEYSPASMSDSIDGFQIQVIEMMSEILLLPPSLDPTEDKISPTIVRPAKSAMDRATIFKWDDPLDIGPFKEARNLASEYQIVRVRPESLGPSDLSTPMPKAAALMEALLRLPLARPLAVFSISRRARLSDGCVLIRIHVLCELLQLQDRKELSLRRMLNIFSGKVSVDGKVVNKAGTQVSDKAVVEIMAEVPKYVCRAGYKLEAAIEQLGIDIEGRVALDSGLSTGGFTDCLLQYDASFVYGVDVGYGQVADKIRRDERVSVIERTNLRYLPGLPQKVDLVMPAVVNVMKDESTLVTLVKPQFEARRSQVGSGGIVRDPSVHKEVLERIIKGVEGFGFSNKGWIESPLKAGFGPRVDLTGCLLYGRFDLELACITESAVLMAYSPGSRFAIFAGCLHALVAAYYLNGSTC